MSWSTTSAAMRPRKKSRARSQKWASQAMPIQADVSNEEQVTAMFRQMFDSFGTIDILVNNAGPAAGRAVRRDDAGAVEYRASAST